MRIEMFIPGAPGAKGRPRFTRGGRVYTPELTVAYSGYLKSLMAAEMEGRPPLEGPVRLDLSFHMPEPKSMPKRDRGKALPHVKKPDLDNLEKAVMDAANGVVVKDDSQIFRKDSTKRYSATPGVTMVFSTEDAQADGLERGEIKP